MTLPQQDGKAPIDGEGVALPASGPGHSPKGGAAKASPAKPSVPNAGREGDMVVLRRDEAGKPTVWCDPDIADLIDALNTTALATVASCSGHGHRPGRITLADGRELFVAKGFEQADFINRNLPYPDINGVACEPMDPLSGDGWCEWIHPLPGYLMQCCDCGLVHEMDFRIGARDGYGPLNPGESDESGVIIFRARRHYAQAMSARQGQAPAGLGAKPSSAVAESDATNPSRQSQGGPNAE